MRPHNRALAHRTRAVKQSASPVLAGGTGSLAAVAAGRSDPRALFYRALALEELDRSEEATEVMIMLAMEENGKYPQREREFLRSKGRGD